jgi:hypothetical protein
MKRFIAARVLGWAQFLLTGVREYTQCGVPHTTVEWAILGGALALAIGVHAAAGNGSTT